MKERLILAMNRVTRFFRVALRWWVGELLQITPASLRKKLSRPVSWIVVDISDTELVFGTLGEEYCEIGRSPIDGIGATTTNLLSDISVQPGRAKIAVRLVPEMVMRRVVVLPQLAELQLRQVLAFELERQTPFLSEHILFDYKVSSRNRDRKEIWVDVAIVPKATIERIQDAVRKSGLSLTPALIGALTTKSSLPEFVFRKEKKRLSAKNVTPTFALGCLIACLVLVDGVSWGVRQDRILADIDGKITEAKSAAEHAKKLRERIVYLDSQSHFLENQRARPRLIQTLDALTRLLPDDTWVTDLELTGDFGAVTGYSRSASKLIGSFGTTAQFKNAKFRSPITSDGSKDGLERFDMSFDIRGIGR